MSPKRGVPLWYWDSCIFLAWLNYDWDHVPGVMEGIEEMVAAIHGGKATLFTSVITKTEVLEHKMKPVAQTKFAAIFKRRNVTFVNHDERIGDRSHAIRNHYAQPPHGRMLETSDCVHLATAILYNAECFYTLDGAGPRKRKTDLIPLNGNVDGYPLRIEMPMSKEPKLLGFGLPTQGPKKPAKPGS